MPHVTTVNQRTLPPALNQGFLATTGSMGERWQKTIADVFADVLSTRPGDRIFFQITNRSVGASSKLDEYLTHVNFDDPPPYSTTPNGFTGIAEVEDRPYFDSTRIGDGGTVPESVPVRVPFSCQQYLPTPVTEERAFTYEISSTELWNPKYKKALQGSKTLTSMTPAEGDQLAGLVNKHNDRIHNISQESYSGDDSRKISINDRLDQSKGDPGVRDTPPDSIGELSLNEIPFTSGSKFRVEKTLEAWLMEMIDTEHDDLREVFGPKDELSWFTNYVPYGISGKNMDGLVFHERNGLRYKISTIELKRGKGRKSHVKQVLDYARWVTNYLANGDPQVVQPVLIARRFSEEAVKTAEAQLGPRSPMLVSYRVANGSCFLDIKTGRPVR